jgi:hypothetical protein
MLKRVNKFLTPNKRKAIYGVVAAAIAALLAFDVVSASDLSESLSAIILVLGGLSSILAFVNVSPGPNDNVDR